MENRTQLNRQINETVINNHVLGNSTVINMEITDNEENRTGDLIDGKYLLQSKMNMATGEADLYICTYENRNYVAKIYRRKGALKAGVAEKLKSIESPYVAKIYATGNYNGYPYEILPYYKNGSLERKTYTFEQLKSDIIPSLNEGLKVLHDAGIIHKDLKPSNIMLADNGTDVAIIDFGISSIREEGNTVIVTKTGMTPEYSAPETFKNLFLNESDYYSLGITLYELYCGHTPYSQMGQEEIEQYVSVQKLPLPSDMNEELKILISALTYPDITNRKNKSNPNRRWGYEEILKWCVGIKQSLPGETTGQSYINGNIRPYKFLGETYTDRDSLISALIDNWDAGKKQLFRGLLSAYFKNFDAEMAGFCIDAEEEVSDGDEDVIFFRTMYKINPDMTRFFWKGNQVEDLSKFGEMLLEKLWVEDYSMLSMIDELLEKSIFSQYLICINDDDIQRASALKGIESSFKTLGQEPRHKMMNYYLLAYMLSGKKVMYKEGMEFTSLQDLLEYMKKAIEQSYDEFEKICHSLIDYNDNLDAQFESWLIALGKINEIGQWRKQLQS